eukprot:gene12180-2229_t
MRCGARALLGDKVDTLHLALIANRVTQRREEGMFQFSKALAHPTQPIVRRYSQFLRQVMLDSEAADVIDARLAELQEKRHEGRMHAGSAEGSPPLGCEQNLLGRSAKGIRIGTQRSRLQRNQSSSTI